MDKHQKLEKLEKTMSEDESLPLKKGATRLVFGEGSPEAEIMFVGEGPGFWEDKKGRPFVGNAGAFLNQLLVSIELPRQNVFITNVIHYRPPANRDPQEAEIKAFEPYLDKMIDIIDPKIIVTLGRFSMGKFLANAKITSVHGKKFEINWKGRKLVVVPMYHPAAGLRSIGIKQQTIADFKKLLAILDEIKKGGKRKDAEQMQLV